MPTTAHLDPTSRATPDRATAGRATTERPTTDRDTADARQGGADRVWPRRAVLAGSGAALLACAACGSSSSTAVAASAAPNSGATGGSGSTTALAAIADIPAGSGLIVTAPSGQVILAKADGKVVAHTAVCTHQGAIIDGAGVCPLHGSKFNVSTGAVIDGPASDPLAAVPVTEKDGKVYAG